MLLLELPPELLIVLYERLPNASTLLKLTQTCHYAQEVFLQDSPSILNNVLKNAYPGLDGAVKDTIAASESHGAFDYSYALQDHFVQWIAPQAYNPWSLQNLTPERALDLLKTLVDFEADIENLTNWCTPLCVRKTLWNHEEGISTRESVVHALVRLQLVTNRLYNVRLPAFPEHISLREYERDKPSTFISKKLHNQIYLSEERQILTNASPHLRDLWSVSRKTRDQAQDLMKDQLRTLDVPHLRNMWLLMQILQDEYLVLRRHRLRARPLSLMDLLFEHNSDESGWSPSPWFSVQSLLSEMGVHVVPARPGTAFRFLGHEAVHEVQYEDIDAFNRHLERIQLGNTSEASFPNCGRCPMRGCDGLLCLSDYLERFRPLLGLSYLDETSITDLVEPKAAIRSTVGANRYWTHASSTKVEQSRLGEALQECGEKNQRRRVSRSKQRLRVGRKDSRDCDSFPDEFNSSSASSLRQRIRLKSVAAYNTRVPIPTL